MAVSPITRSMRAATYSSAPPCSKGISAFLTSSACAAIATSYPSCSAAPLPWPSAFRGLRPCPSLGAPFWPSGLTLRSSGPAFCGPLTLAVSPITRSMREATYFSARPCTKRFLAFLASSACAASATSYHSRSTAPLSWPSAFWWAAPLSKSGRFLLAFGSNSAVKRTASPPLTLVR